MQFLETSREKNANGDTEYEALVFIGRDQMSFQHACLWFDVTGGGGVSTQSIGHAKPNGDEITFLFRGSDGSIFHTTFMYNRSIDTWNWLMDVEENGNLLPFARVELTKK
jgi:hypothetical protein